MHKKTVIYILLTVLFVPLSAFADEEQNNPVIFQQYKQKTVKPYDNSYVSSYMDYMFIPHSGRFYRNGFTFFGYDMWQDAKAENDYLIRDIPEDTLVDPNEYTINSN